MGGLLTLPSFVKVFPEIDVTDEGQRGLTQSQKNHRSTIQGISVASYNVGCFCGAVSTIWIGDLLGRRKTIFLGSLIMVVGAVLQSSAFSLSHFIVGRVITGRPNSSSALRVKAESCWLSTIVVGTLLSFQLCNYVCEQNTSTVHNSLGIAVLFNSEIAVVNLN